MRIRHLNHSDVIGGAARAAYRLHSALREAGEDSMMQVNLASSGDWTVLGPTSNTNQILMSMRPVLAGLSTRLLRTDHPIMHSPAVLPSGRVKVLNTCDADLLHLHWTQQEMLSISDIGKLSKPLVWSLHDMWAFCGAEHVTEDFRWREGYTSKNRPDYERGFDINRWTWSRKQKHWKRPIQIVTPSHWLGRCVQESALMRDWPVRVIPNALDTNLWQPIEKRLARDILGLSQDEKIILFGAVGGGRHLNKGFDLLKAGLDCLRGEIKGVNLVIFGELPPCNPLDLGFPTCYTGHLHDDVSLRLLYSAADVMVVPSRIEAFGQTASEAHACGTPVVAFDTSGLPDIVKHKETGYLAKPFDVEDLARGIQWVLTDQDRSAGLGLSARQEAVAKFSYPIVAKQYVSLYKEILGC